MLTKDFRPWGLFPWVFQRLQDRKWDILACLATEERCLGVPYQAKEVDGFHPIQFLKIVDPEPVYKEKRELKIASNKKQFEDYLGEPIEPLSFDLLGSPVLLKKYMEKFIANSTGNVIIDISSFPKGIFSQ